MLNWIILLLIFRSGVYDHCYVPQRTKTESMTRSDSYLFPSLQTEEDYIPYPSVHEVHVMYCK